MYILVTIRVCNFDRHPQPKGFIEIRIFVIIGYLKHTIKEDILHYIRITSIKTVRVCNFDRHPEPKGFIEIRIFVILG